MPLRPIIAGQFYNDTSGSPAGATGTLQYNNGGAFGGITGWTTDGANALTGGAGTSLAVGGATIGSNALAVTGTSLFTGNISHSGVFTTTEVNIGNGTFAIYNNGNTVTLWNGGNICGAASTGLKIKSDKRIEFSDGDMAGTSDAFLARVAAGVINATALAGTTQALSGPGAVNVTTLTTKVTSTGVGDALTLANGVDGQLKIIIHDVDGGSAVLTPTTATGYTTITFTNAGESATLQFVTTRGWMILALRGAVAA